MKTLIITGCINPPPNTPYLALTDKEERERQYIDSIRWYIAETAIENIVYCDNSDQPPKEELSALAKTCNKNFEWISFRGDREKGEEFGKGYGEGEIIAYAIENSELLKRSDWYVKVTGRLKIMNIEKILSKVKKRGFYGWTAANRIAYKNPLVDTRFYIADKDTYAQYFHDAYLQVRDREDITIEKVFRDILVGENVYRKTPPLFPDFVGQSGSIGCFYNASGFRLFVKTLLCKTGFYSVRYDKKSKKD